MRYANFKYNGKTYNNAGDQMQILAMDYIYSQMGIGQEEIEYIDISELDIYDGDYVVLPIIMALLQYPFIHLSPKIIPVYISFITDLIALEDHEVAHFRRYEPIGCRDVYTHALLRRYGIWAYVNGCITALFPKADSISRRDNSTVYFADVPEELIPHIPDAIKKNAVEARHILPANLPNPKEETQKLYDMYIHNAALVITSRLHCAVPCMAAGIPVVLARISFPTRYAWLDKFLPLYTLDKFTEIDWAPDPVQYEEHKARMLKSIIKRLSDTHHKYRDIYSISSFFEGKREQHFHLTGFDEMISFIESKWSKEASFQYSIWGINMMAQNFFIFISQNYPNARLAYVYDAYRKLEFHGIKAQKPSMIEQHEDSFLFVMAAKAIEQISVYLQSIKKSPETYYLFKVN